MKALIIANPVKKGLGGGAKRSFKVLNEYPKFGVEAFLYVPLQRLINMIFNDILNENKFLEEYINSFKKLEKKVNVPNYIYEYLESEKVRLRITQLTKGSFSHLKRFAFFNFNTKMLAEEKKIIEEFLKNVPKVDYIYSMHENFENVYCLCHISRSIPKHCFVLLQIEPYRLRNYEEGNLLIRMHNAATSYIYNFKTKKVYERILKSKRLRCIFSVSTTPLKLSKLDNLACKFGVETKILRPANSFDQDILSHGRVKKDDYATFYARLVPGKGIFEIPYIWKIVEKEVPDAKLIICGNFGSLRHRNAFFSLIKKLGLRNIHYKGFISGTKLYELVSGAKVLLYPSHEDSFSLVVLESLALGTIVVAYNIPAIKEVYGDLVYTVQEGEINSMAEEVIKVLKMSESEYRNKLKKLKNFLKLYSSWENVAKTEIEEIKKLLG